MQADRWLLRRQQPGRERAAEPRQPGRRRPRHPLGARNHALVQSCRACTPVGAAADACRQRRMELDVKRVRPIAARDLDALLELARGAGTGFTSLPPVREVLEKKIARSIASFAEGVELPGPRSEEHTSELQASGEKQGG